MKPHWKQEHCHGRERSRDIRGLDRAPFGILDELVYQLRASPDAPHSLHVRRGNSTAIVQINAGKLDDIRFRLQTAPVN